MGYGPWGQKESDTTERLTLHFLEFLFTELHAVVQVVIHYYLFCLTFIIAWSEFFFFFNGIFVEYLCDLCDYVFM